MSNSRENIVSVHELCFHDDIQYMVYANARP